MTRLVSIILFLFDQPGQTVLFDDPTIVKDKNGNSIFECWGASLHDHVWLMDENGDWHELEASDVNADIVIETVWNRLTAEKEKAA